MRGALVLLFASVLIAQDKPGFLVEKLTPQELADYQKAVQTLQDVSKKIRVAHGETQTAEYSSSVYAVCSYGVNKSVEIKGDYALISSYPYSTCGTVSMHGMLSIGAPGDTGTSKPDLICTADTFRSYCSDGSGSLQTNGALSAVFSIWPDGANSNAGGQHETQNH